MKTILLMLLAFLSFNSYSACVEKNGAIVCKYKNVDKKDISSKVIRIPPKNEANLCKLQGEIGNDKEKYYLQENNKINSWRVSGNDKINILALDDNATIYISENACSTNVQKSCIIEKTNFSGVFNKQCFNKNNKAYLNVYIKNCKKCQVKVFK